MVIAAKSASQVLLHMAVAFGVMYAVTGSLRRKRQLAAV